MKRLPTLVLLASALCACDATEPSVPKTLTLSPVAITLDAVGAKQVLTATILDQRGDPMRDVGLVWSASDPAATVLSTGGDSATVTASANGTATITARVGDATATAAVTVTQVPASVEKVMGDAQTGRVGDPLASGIRVLVKDRLGVGIGGQIVSFLVAQGGGALSSPSDTTAADGTAEVFWTLGTVAGGAQEATATVGGSLTTTFTATATPGAPAALAITDGNGQTATVGSAVSRAISARVSDRYGNAVPGVEVTFAVASGGGSLSSATATTSANGVASGGTWTLGTVAGANTLRVSAAGVPDVTVSATGVAGAPTRLAAVTETQQSAPVGTAVASAPSVRVTDRYDNGVAGVIVSFTTIGGGSLTGASQTSDAGGVATVGGWTLGSSAGSYFLSASAPGLASVLFSATATTSSSTPRVSANAATSQAAMVGQGVPYRPSVVVRDGNGTPLQGRTVTFAVTSGGGSVSGAVATTNASGVATASSWTLGSQAGPNTVTATVSGAGVINNPVTFTAYGCTGGGGSGYAITLCYTSSLTGAQRAAFESAVAKWGRVITQDLPDIPATISAGSCDTGSPAISTTIDDLLIFSSVVSIDGPGGTLGSAGPCYTRTIGSLPVIGVMRFDVSDMASLESSGRLTAVVLHEIGHILGIGTMWSSFGLLQDRSSTFSTLDTYYPGTNGVAGFDAIGGASYTGGRKVPVENTGGSGTMNAHWRESVLANELMTGYVNNGSNPMSLLTVRSLADMGYVVDPGAADAFSLTLARRTGDGASTGLHLENDVYTGPLFRIDTRGRFNRIR